MSLRIVILLLVLMGTSACSRQLVESSRSRTQQQDSLRFGMTSGSSAFDSSVNGASLSANSVGVEGVADTLSPQERAEFIRRWAVPPPAPGTPFRRLERRLQYADSSITRSTARSELQVRVEAGSGTKTESETEAEQTTRGLAPGWWYAVPAGILIAAAAIIVLKIKRSFRA